MIKRLLMSVACVLLTGCVRGNEKTPADYVNPIIGASTSVSAGKSFHGLGKTFPGSCTPFGLVQLSPDTRTGGDNGPGYSWHHNTIEGFSFIHMSGIGWYGDFGNFLVMPTTGALHTYKGTEEQPEEGYRSRYSHDTEVTQAGYYAVMLDDYQIKTELTSAPRSGLLRFTYPQSQQARIQIDLARRIAGSSDEQFVEVVDDHTIRGWMRCTPECGGWGNGDGQVGYTVYYYCQFDKPLQNYGVWTADIPEGVSRKNEANHNPDYAQYIKEAKCVQQPKQMQGKHLGFYTEFATTGGEQVMLKCGISFVSMEGAQANLQQDIPDWDFARVRAANRALWNEALSKVQVKGGEREKTIFYTALYHTMIDPRCCSDSDGAYVGADQAVHTSQDFIYRTIFSGWDVFRSQFPLQTLINPRLVDDEINSLIQLAELSGKRYFPRWEIMNSYSGCMLGNPAISVLTDAYQKGIRHYEVDKAVDYAIRTQQTFGNGELTGYVPGDLSRTLEYAYTDWCLGELLTATGAGEKAAPYYQKGKAYQQVWCDSVHWFRARLRDGSWLPWKGRTVHDQGTTESNPFQQGWFVPHDVEGFKQLMGGQQRFDAELDSFFVHVPADFLWNDYYNHPNEPNHHVLFLFNYSSHPWKTQYWTRAICDKAYGTDVMGLCGNEDVGQMSAWYILAAMGIHPICPGNPRYELTSPVFDEVEISLDPAYYPGKRFTIIAHNNSPKNIYIQSISLNGKPLNRLWISHEEIIRGGVLEFEMGDHPVDSYGLE